MHRRITSPIRYFHIPNNPSNMASILPNPYATTSYSPAPPNQSHSTKPPRTFPPSFPSPHFNPHLSNPSSPYPQMSSSSSMDDDAATLADAPNRSYELSGKIMLSAIVILFAVVIFMIFLHLYARWYLLRARRRQLQRRNRTRRQNLTFYVDSATTPSSGLEKSVLMSLPVFEFKVGEEKKEEVSECAVCLSEFEIGEKGRSLPKCKHSFHIECIDMWFASHSTCPLCRAPVESVASEESQSQLVDSVTQPESEAVVVSATTDTSSTSSFGASGSKTTQRELKGFTIEIPKRNELNETESSNDSPQSYKSPGGRMMSLRRILTRGLSMSMPSTPDVSTSGACCDLEMGMREETSRGRVDSVV